MPRTTSWRLRPALPLLLLSYLFLANFSWTIAIPTNNSSNESSNHSEVVVANITERSPLDNISSEKIKNDAVTEPTRAQIVDSEEIELCESETTLMYPKSVMSKNSEWFMSADHKQSFLVELCLRVDHKCKFDDAFPLGFTSSCVQRYNYRPMLVVVNGEVKEELVRLPSHCKCVLKPRHKI